MNNAGLLYTMSNPAKLNSRSRLAANEHKRQARNPHRHHAAATTEKIRPHAL